MSYNAIHLIAKVLHMSRTLVALEVISFCPRESWNEMLQIYNSVWMDAVDKLNFKGDTVQCFCRYMYKSLGKWTRTRNECYMFRYRYKYAEYRTILEAVWCLFLSILFAYQIWKKKHYPRVNFDRPLVSKCDWVLMNLKTSKSTWVFFLIIHVCFCYIPIYRCILRRI